MILSEKKGSNNMDKFAKRLRELRNEKGISIRQAAKDLDVGKTTLSNYERGKRSPNKDFINRAADYYNVSADYLLGKIDDKHAKRIYSMVARGELTENDVNDVKDYIDFLINKKKEDDKN